VVFIAIAITFINAVLKAVLRFTSNFEKAHTITDTAFSSTMKMFAVQFINIVSSGFNFEKALIIQLVNWNLETKWLSLPQDFPILRGNYEEFS